MLFLCGNHLRFGDMDSASVSLTSSQVQWCDLGSSKRKRYSNTIDTKNCSWSYMLICSNIDTDSAVFASSRWHTATVLPSRIAKAVFVLAASLVSQVLCDFFFFFFLLSSSHSDDWWHSLVACQPVKRLLIFVTWCVFGGEKKAKNRKLLAMYWDNIVMFGCDETKCYVKC